MLERLRPKLDAEGHSHVSLAKMDGMALDVESESFDAALCQFGVMLFPEPARGIQELYRVLKPGRRAIVTAWAGPEKFESFGVFGKAIRRALPDLELPSPPPIFSLSDENVFTSMLKDAGFSEASVEHVTRVWTKATAEEFTDIFTSSAPPARALFAAIGPEGAKRVRDAMHEVLKERFGNGPVELKNTATMGIARR
jgi:ubiquinone/menaquinone biosynthesis C-methylase UbiE